MKRIDKKAKLNADTEFRRDLLFRVLSNNLLQSRMTYGNTQTFGGNRDVYTALGYPAMDKINYSDFYAKYKRQDIASAIIDKPVYGAWKMPPMIRTDDNNSETDPFQEAWENLVESHKLINVFQRVDKLAGIGRYATLFIGINDGTETLAEPIGKSKELLYIQPYSEENAIIKTVITDKNNARYALPDKYTLRSVQINQGNISLNTYNKEMVDSSRIIHIADNVLENTVYGMSRLEKIYNRLLNMELIVGGSAEMFWQGAFPGLAFSVKDGFELDSDDLTVLEEEIKKYVHQLERYMKLNGLDVQNLSSSVADPVSHVDVQLKMISIASNIPKRILEGSERGELASSQDTKAWNEFLDNRRKTFCEHDILRPTIDRFIEIGILPEPKGGTYLIEWPDLDVRTDKDIADVGKVRTEALRSYASTPDAQMIVPPKSFLEEIMDLKPEKVDRIMMELEDYIKEMMEMEEEFEEEDDNEFIDPDEDEEEVVE